MERHKQAGFTLIEVLGAVVLLAIAVTAAVYLLGQTALFSGANARAGESVTIARTVMEELKHHLRSGGTIDLYGQQVDLAALQSTAPPYTLGAALHAPDAEAPQFDITVQSLAPAHAELTLDGETYEIDHYFRYIRITVASRSQDSRYTLEGYAAYQ
ncbi:prepilin-type N-terminal cleavage/methylation domain-containing protein [Paenibacillus sp. IB182496]|uniref:Prepilin-type N-terminal cleavage/methylation domain-containing protein n=1 Tax=Paenibacillus sabuli TaxID=2772509 RepID=A0A927BWN2_9BACL|nr:prepilin-type N-terminal cleavage/methylation domain-containing protein [Paenibacillus sabuli]MBD2848217.1 prepilin-type N-terminal cleavage/methylation domain-containing protein [Paenibacillus sabuli]